MRRDAKGAPDKVPFVSIVDRDNNLHRAIVDDRLMRAALRCRESWHSLQELGGIHNSHAERLLAKEKQSWEDQATSEAAARAPEAKAPAPQPRPEQLLLRHRPRAAEPEETEIARRGLHRDAALHDLQRVHADQRQDVRL